MIAPDDLVLLYHSDRMCYLTQVPSDGRFSTHRGYIEYRDMIGKEYGDCVRTHMGIRFFLLKPTLADLELHVKRATTIAYPKDIGFVLLQTFVFPGARVIEVGSGSGALTTVLASLVRPDGRVYSYERRLEMTAVAKSNLKRYGLEDYCDFILRDPSIDGFGQNNVDAVIIDVPEPWTLVPPAQAALKTGNVLAVLVPTVEQVRNTCSAMQLSGFVRLKVSEILERNWFVRATGLRPPDRMVGHTVFVVSGHSTLDRKLLDRTMSEEGG
ncbi:MAG: tRNA (adenine-N1)-methyltransferase [candidate division WOR-3 bacterium]